MGNLKELGVKETLKLKNKDKEQAIWSVVSVSIIQKEQELLERFSCGCELPMRERSC